MILRCSHVWGFPRRRSDGQDWQTCLLCGTDRLSLVQFTNYAGVRVDGDTPRRRLEADSVRAMTDTPFGSTCSGRNPLALDRDTELAGSTPHPGQNRNASDP